MCTKILLIFRAFLGISNWEIPPTKVHPTHWTFLGRGGGVSAEIKIHGVGAPENFAHPHSFFKLNSPN